MTSQTLSRQPSKLKVLVVDDEPHYLDKFHQTFHLEFQVLRAGSGEAALLCLVQNPDIAAMIVDQHMPGMSGMELLGQVARRYTDVIRILSTAAMDMGDLAAAINVGDVFKYIIPKPWQDEQLRTVLQKVISSCNERSAESLGINPPFHEITYAIRSAETSQDMLQVIAHRLGEAFAADYCVVRPLYDLPREAQSCLVYRAESATPFESQLLADTAIQTERLQVFTDPGRLAAEHPAYQQLAPRCSVVVPLTSRRTPLAILALHHCQSPKAWDPEVLERLQTLSGEAALALGQTWAYEQVQALAQREFFINAINQSIHGSLEPKQIFATITEKLGKVLKTDGCAISLWTQSDEYMNCVGLYNAREGNVLSPPKSQVKISENPILQDLLKNRAPVVFDNLATSPLHTPMHLSLHAKAQALLLVPLITDGEIIGSISLRQAESRHWQMEEINLAQAVANQAAIAVQQARLYQTTRQQAEQLLALDKQKTTFFQNISHEFRTPLTLTIGPLEAAVQEGTGLSSEQSVMALRNSRRLLRLVNQLLDLQRLDAGRMQATFYACDFAQVVRNVVESFQAYCDRKRIILSSQIQPCPPVYLDLEKFDKVIYNILSNAVKFTPAGGSIQITLNTFENTCYLEIEDTGIGIRKAQLPHIFERFQQADGSASRTHEGTGLGLALVKELVELHGGEVRVASAYGTGTTFTVELPVGADHLPAERVNHAVRTLEHHRATVELADLNNEVASDDEVTSSEATTARPSTPSRPASRPTPTAEATILVVDDNPDLRGYVASILQRQGHHIHTAHNGAAGLDLARSVQPQLIITDLMMPQVSGIELIQQVRLDPELQGIPIILLTAKVDDETRLDGIEQGADAYLSKPFQERELLAEVRNLLALKATERQVAELNQYLTESVLQRFLPAPLVQKAAQGNLPIELKPEPRLVTVLFSDIVGFTQLSNTLRSRRVAELLNDYLEVMTQTIFANGGTVDKFMGDAILALFGAPESLTPNEQVRRAIATARQMYIALEDLNQRWQGVPDVKFRCGIHQGTAVVGMFGSSQRSDYTAIGPSVNIAARLQEAADSESILVSAAVADYLDEQEIIKSRPRQLKGIDETVLTFTVNPSLPV